MKLCLLGLSIAMISIGSIYAATYDVNQRMPAWPYCETNTTTNFLSFHCGSDKAEHIARILDDRFEDFEQKLQDMSENEKIRIYDLVRYQAQRIRLTLNQDDIFREIDDYPYQEVKNETLFLRQLVLSMIEYYMTHRIQIIEGTIFEE